VTRPWETLDSAETPEGRLELLRRGEDFVITVGGRVLMNSALHLTEAAVAEMACRRIAGRDRPRVLIGGLGMGYTLRAALDALPRKGRVVVAEIEPAIVRWCRGPLAGLTRRAIDDPRVSIRMADVTQMIAATAETAETAETGETADTKGAHLFDAIILDLFEGPRTATQARDDPFYGPRALERTRAALTRGGVFAVWSEDADPAFAKRLSSAGFTVETARPGQGGPRHVVYLAGSGRRRDRGSVIAP
jgi:spermidine synthase